MRRLILGISCAGAAVLAAVAGPLALAAGGPTVTVSPPTVTGSTSAAFSGQVDNPAGTDTRASFEYGLDPSYTGGKLIYDNQTLSLPVGSDTAENPVSASVTGLVPNAIYHVRLVAVSTAGRTLGPDQTFRTAKDPSPPPPVLGRSVDTAVVSGVVLVRFPDGFSIQASGPRAGTALAKGQGYVPLTEARRIPIGSKFDTRRGTVSVTTAAGTGGKDQTGLFSGGLFKLTQQRHGLLKGLASLALLEGAFPGAPNYASCRSRGAAADAAVGGRPLAGPARLSSRVLQTLHSRDNHGRFRTRGRYSAGTVRGTQWDTTDRCDGTLTTVRRGTVSVRDFNRRTTVLVRAHHSYLAHAPLRR